MKLKVYVLQSFFLAFISSQSPLVLAADGNGTSGGGDLCEDRIKVIRDDLADWINKGGPVGLQLPKGTSSAKYSASMLNEIKTAGIKCVGPGDAGYPIKIGNTAKVCRFDLAASSSQITCDYGKFNSTDETDQYVLIHHEYAGLAGIEAPDGDSSTYTVSNQISEYLVDTVVKKLAVKDATTQPIASQRKCSLTEDGFFDKFTAALRAVILTEISNLKKTHGISVDLNSFNLSMSYNDYWGDGNLLLVNAGATFNAIDGTQFTVSFDSRERIWWDPHLYSKGFDREGNPINGHCFMEADRDEPIRYDMIISNSASGVTIDTFKIFHSLQLY